MNAKTLTYVSIGLSVVLIGLVLFSHFGLGNKIEKKIEEAKKEPKLDPKKAPLEEEEEEPKMIHKN